MPQVSDAIRKNYGKEPKILEPDEAVAKGAAIHAVSVYINNQKSLSEWKKSTVETPNIAKSGVKKVRTEVKITDYSEALAANSEKVAGQSGKRKKVVVATTKSFALQVYLKGQPKCCNMIIKNEPMINGNISVTKQFGTFEDNQETAEIIVYESDFLDEYFEVDDSYILGTVSLELPPNLPNGSPVRVTFTLNTQGILEVASLDLTHNQEVHARMQSKTIMEIETVNELKEKSQHMAVS
jgi:molecular chaperone DnaK (HSP70)